MIGTTHAIAGAAIGSLMPTHPVAAFVFGVVSHYALDSVPHWDYPLYSVRVHKGDCSSMTMRRALVRDFFNVGFDLAVGVIISFMFFYNPASLIAVCAGLVGGVLPDFLQFVYACAPRTPMKYLQQFHHWIHTSHKLRQEGKSAIGIVYQVAIVVAIIAMAKIF